MDPRPLPQPGEPAPWFIARSTSNERYHFDTVGGRCVVLCFLGSAADAYSRGVVECFLRHRAVFNDERACFFGVTADPRDEREARLTQVLPGYRYFWDFDLAVSKLYGVHRGGTAYERYTIVLDPRLRVLAVVPFGISGSPEQHVAAVLEVLSGQPPIAADDIQDHAPVLIVPRVFEPEFCRELIACYEQGNAEPSGFMREQDGKTVGVFDDGFKKRRDVSVTDQTLRLACRKRLENRLKPEVFKAFQFLVTYAERYIVACYDATEGGFFRAHRDNTTKGTAHRRFAVTLNLNTGEYEGGQLRFPEYGPRGYEAPLGGAIVFSCSLLHEATPVTRGRRYAFLPFFYDEPAAKLRERNLPFVEAERQPPSS
ncbi:MAG TPA: 2OG-Fe(II) oxygenase [Burkholderiales bacterium]|nr:2OG-Fe(II) oxygenase [Burkholderiales bacterium]